MKHIIPLMFVTTNVFAGSFVGEAMVVDVNPNYVTQEVPRQVCNMVSSPVQVTYPGQVVRQRNNTGRLILNTAIGAAIGHQFGKGKGKDAATIAGGLLGYSSTEPDITYANGRTVTEYRQVEQCRTVYDTQQVQNGYIVKYNYNNYIGVMHTSTYPGSTVSVNITVGE